MEIEKTQIGTEEATGCNTRTGHELFGSDTESAEVTPNALLLCFSGKIGSGKTSTSKAVASELGCGYASFGDYLKDVVARQGGDPDRRESLQYLGQSRIEQDAEAFCRDVVAAGGFVPGEDFVLDGVRHVDTLPHIVQIAAPSEVRLIFLDADAGLRSSRVGERSAKEGADFDRAASHVVESEIADKLPKAAHAIVDSSLPSRDVIEQCIRLIDKWRWARACVASKSEAQGTAGGTRRT